MWVCNYNCHAKFIIIANNQHVRLLLRGIGNYTTEKLANQIYLVQIKKSQINPPDLTAVGLVCDTTVQIPYHPEDTASQLASIRVCSYGKYQK